MSSGTRDLRGRPVAHDEAEASVQRLINSMFGSRNGGRASIPVSVDDDDVVVSDYIAEQRELVNELHQALKKAEFDFLGFCGSCNHFQARTHKPDCKLAAALSKATGNTKDTATAERVVAE